MVTHLDNDIASFEASYFCCSYISVSSPFLQNHKTSIATPLKQYKTLLVHVILYC